MNKPRSGQGVRHNVFVTNISCSITDRDVREAFSRFGEILDLSVRPDKMNSNSNVGYIKYSSEAEAEKCVRECSRDIWPGMSLKIMRINSNQSKNHPKQKGSNSLEYIKDSLMVICVNDPCSFWAQSQKNYQQIVDLENKLRSYQAGCPVKLQGRPVINEIYGCIYKNDKTLYRCRVLEFNTSTSCEIRYIDFGNGEAVDSNELYQLPKQLISIPPLANCYKINQLIPVDYNSPYYQKGTSFLKEVLCNKIVDCRIYEQKHGNSESFDYLVDIKLPNSDINLKNELVNRGFAVKASGGSSHRGGGDGGREFDEMTRSSVDSERKHSNDQRRRGGSNNSKSGNKHNKSHLKNRQKFSGEETQTLFSSSWSNEETDPESRKCENSEATTSNTAQQQLLGSLNKKQSELSFETVMANVLKLMEQTRQQRRQFTTDADSNDCIEATAQLSIQDMDKINLQDLVSHAELERSIKEYTDFQKSLNICKDLKLLDTLVTTRDQSRIKLHQNLTAFISELELLPLEERFQALQAAKQTLSTVYETYFSQSVETDETDFDTLLANYREWKTNTRRELSKMRIKTDKWHTTCNQMFMQIQKAMSWNCSIDTNVYLHIIPSLESLTNALEEEVECCIHQTTLGTSVIAQTVHTLAASLENECNDIATLTEQCVHYKKLLKEIEPWLNKKPNLNSCKENSQKMKTLKSKLRHKLADLKDLEEEEDVDEHAIQVVKRELTDIRDSLHKEFASEDSIVTEFVHLQAQHFPELLHLHPNVDLNLESLGLVKEGRDLECYDIKPFIPAKAKTHGALFLAKVLGKPSLFQEYEFASESTRKEFSSKVIPFASISCPNVVAINAVLSPKGKIKSYVQMPFYKYNLIERVSTGSMSNEVKQRIIISVAKGIKALHDKQIIHCSLHPSNILLNEDNDLVVAPFDLSSTLEERIERAYSEWNFVNGISFVAPEAREQFVLHGKTSTSIDVYSLGCICLYLFWPKVQFIMNSSGTPNLFALQKIPATAFVQKLLNPVPEDRPTVADVLGDPFLNDLSSQSSLSSDSHSIMPLSSMLKIFKKQQQPESGSVGFVLTDKEKEDLGMSLAQMSVKDMESDDDDEVLSDKSNGVL